MVFFFIRILYSLKGFIVVYLKKVFSIVFMGFTAFSFAGNPEDLARFAQTGICIAGDLSFYDLKAVIKDLNARTIPIVLEGTDLEGVDLAQSSLQNADFGNTLLKNANFKNADLKNANFLLAILTDATFEKACLDYAIFERAYCPGTNFKNATTYETDFTDTVFKRLS